jgi:hypothetical protein
MRYSGTYLSTFLRETLIRLTHALAHLARPVELPAVSLTGFILGAALGFVFYRLRENQKRLQRLHQEFEIQVATLRHHYKNLALGISGFSGRARRNLPSLLLIIFMEKFRISQYQIHAIG